MLSFESENQKVLTGSPNDILKYLKNKCLGLV